MRQRFFDDVNGAAEKLFDDVGANAFKVYDVSDYNQIVHIPVHPENAMQKFTHITIATSGDQVCGKTWMVIAPYRLDESKATREKCYDIDPVLFVLDSSSLSQHPSGVVAYHQGYDGRTTPVSGYETYPMSKAVTDIRSKIILDQQPLPNAPPEVLNALQHMVGKFKSDFLNKREG